MRIESTIKSLSVLDNINIYLISSIDNYVIFYVLLKGNKLGIVGI